MHQASSVRAARLLIEAGVKDAAYLAGGFAAWAGAGYPLERRRAA